MDFIIYLLFSYSLTSLFLYGEILSPVRDFVDYINIEFFKNLFSCSMCLGFWIGLFNASLFFKLSLIDNFVYAVCSSGVTWLLCSIVQLALWGKVYFESEYKVNK